MEQKGRRIKPGTLPASVVLSLEETADTIDALRAAQAATDDPGELVRLLELAELLADRIEGPL